MLQGAGTQPLQTYLDRRQATVDKWVALRPFLEVYVKYTGYERGGKIQDPWWRQAAAEKKTMVTLEDILVVESDQQRRESRRRVEGKGGE